MNFKIIFSVLMTWALFFNFSLAKTKTDSMVVKVKGMVCAFCAQGVEKNFNKQKQVKKTEINLDKMEVTIFFKPGKTLSEDIIKSVITSAGFSYAGIKK